MPAMRTETMESVGGRGGGSGGARGGSGGGRERDRAGMSALAKKLDEVSAPPLAPPEGGAPPALAIAVCSRDLAEIAPSSRDFWSAALAPDDKSGTRRALRLALRLQRAQRSAIGISAAHNSLALRIAARQLAAADHPARPSLASLCREPDRSTPSAHGALAPAALVTLRRLLPNHWLDAASLDADARVWMRRAAREQAAAVDSGKDPTAGLRLASGADAAGLRALQCELLEGYCSRVEVAVRVAAMRTTAATVGLSLAAAAQRSAGRERPQLLAPFVQCEPSGGGGGGGPPAAGAPEAPAAGATSAACHSGRIPRHRRKRPRPVAARGRRRRWSTTRAHSALSSC